MTEPHSRRFDPSRAERLDDPARRERMPASAVRAALGPLDGKLVADVGAGTGYYTFALLDGEAPPRAIAAVDVSEEMLAVLRSRLQSHQLRSRVELHVAPAESLPLSDSSVDVVVLGNVYHELDDRGAALAEVRRVLGAGGRLLLIDWSVPEEGQQPLVGPPVEHRIAVGVVLDELARAGFATRSLASGFTDVYAIVAA